MVKPDVTKTTEGHQHRVAHCFLIYTHQQKNDGHRPTPQKKSLNASSQEEKAYCLNQSLSPQQKHLNKSRLLKHPLAVFFCGPLHHPEV